MIKRDPFRNSLLALPAWRRLLWVVGILAALWLAIFWAVSLP